MESNDDKSWYYLSVETTSFNCICTTKKNILRHWRFIPRIRVRIHKWMMIEVTRVALFPNSLSSVLMNFFQSWPSEIKSKKIDVSWNSYDDRRILRIPSQFLFDEWWSISILDEYPWNDLKYITFSNKNHHVFERIVYIIIIHYSSSTLAIYMWPYHHIDPLRMKKRPKELPEQTDTMQRLTCAVPLESSPCYATQKDCIP